MKLREALKLREAAAQLTIAEHTRHDPKTRQQLMQVTNGDKVDGALRLEMG